MALIPLPGGVKQGGGADGEQGCLPNVAELCSRDRPLVSCSEQLTLFRFVLFCLCLILIPTLVQPESMRSHFDHVLPQSPHPSCLVLL